MPAPRDRPRVASIDTAMVKRARFAFTDYHLVVIFLATFTGGRAVSMREIPGFASPSHDGFALDDVDRGTTFVPCCKRRRTKVPSP
jgi:hypothetical protein